MLDIIVLAAGTSSRLGKSKQLLTIEGENLVNRVARVACELALQFNFHPPTFIIGKDQQRVEQSLSDLDIELHFNADWQLGMGASIISAVNHLADDTDAILLLSCDQVLLNADSLRSVVECWQANPKKIIASAYNKTIGIPVIFPRRFFSELLQIDPDKGARQVLKKFPDEILSVDLPEAGQDLDTPEDEVLVRRLLEKV